MCLFFREVNSGMDRKNSTKGKKAPMISKEPAGLRRNSTTIASIKRKQSNPKNKLFGEADNSSLEDNSGEVIDNEHPQPPRSPKKILFADEHAKSQVEVEIEPPSEAETLPDQKADEGDLLAELNANLDTMLAKDKGMLFLEQLFDCAVLYCNFKSTNLFFTKDCRR